MPPRQRLTPCASWSTAREWQNYSPRSRNWIGRFAIRWWLQSCSISSRSISRAARWISPKCPTWCAMRCLRRGLLEESMGPRGSLGGLRRARLVDCAGRKPMARCGVSGCHRPSLNVARFPRCPKKPAFPRLPSCRTPRPCSIRWSTIRCSQHKTDRSRRSWPATAWWLRFSERNFQKRRRGVSCRTRCPATASPRSMPVEIWQRCRDSPHS